MRLDIKRMNLRIQYWHMYGGCRIYTAASDIDFVFGKFMYEMQRKMIY